MRKGPSQRPSLPFQNLPEPAPEKTFTEKTQKSFFKKKKKFSKDQKKERKKDMAASAAIRLDDGTLQMWQCVPNPNFASLACPRFRLTFHAAEAECVQAMLLETSGATARGLSSLHQAEAEAEGFPRDPLAASTLCGIQALQALMLLRSGSLLKGGYHLRRAWKSVERAWWAARARWGEARGGEGGAGSSAAASASASAAWAAKEERADLAYARGGFLFCVSLCPPKFRWLISALGMEADQVAGKALLVEAVLTGGTRLAHALHLLLWMEIFYFENEPRAQVVLDCCLKLLPGVPTVLFMEGYLHREVGRLKEAEEAFKRGSLACTYSPQMSANMTYELGWCALLRLDWAEAAALLGSFCETSRSRSFKAFAFYQLGLCRHFQNLPLEAEAAFAQVAAHVRPNFSFDEYARRKAGEYISQGRRWRRGEEILVLASIHAEAKRHDEVIQILEGRGAEGSSESPGDPAAEEVLHRKYLLGMARAGRREVSQAKSLLGAVIAGGASLRIETWLVPWALFGLAELERLQGHLEGTRILCQRALSEHSGYDLDKPLIRKLQARLTPGVFEDKPDDPTWRLKAVLQPHPGLDSKLGPIPPQPSEPGPAREPLDAVPPPLTARAATSRPLAPALAASSVSQTSSPVSASSSAASLASFFSAISTEEDLPVQPLQAHQNASAPPEHDARDDDERDESLAALLPRSTISMSQIMGSAPAATPAASLSLRSLKQLVNVLGEAGHLARWSPDVVLGRGHPPKPTKRDVIVREVSRLLENPSFHGEGLEGTPDQIVDSLVAEGLLVPFGSLGRGPPALLPREAARQSALNLYGLPEARRAPHTKSGRAPLARTAEQISLSLIVGAHAAMDENLVPGGNSPDWGVLRRSPWLRGFILALGELRTLGDPVYPPSPSSMVMTLINLYNVLVFLGHVLLGPPTTLFKRRRFFGSRSPLRLQLGAHMYSIDDIEHGLLRCNRRKPFTVFRPFGGSDPRAGWALPSLDPRIHFALNSGGSSLRFFYSSGDRINEGLDWIASEFVRKEVSITPKGALCLPAIFDYYREDFGGTLTAVALFVAKHAEQAVATAIRAQLAQKGRIEVVFRAFKWDCWFRD